MKSRIVISILLAVLMLGALATPAFAGKPARGDLMEFDGSFGDKTGSVSLQRTRDGHIKLSLVITGATPGEQYFVRIVNGGAHWPDTGDNAIYANSRGVVRVRRISTDPIANTYFDIAVDEGLPYDTVWEYRTYAIIVP